MSEATATDVLTHNETDADAQGNTCLIIRCEDKDGIFKPCFALPLDAKFLARTYKLPLVFIIRTAAQEGQS